MKLGKKIKVNHSKFENLSKINYQENNFIKKKMKL